MHSVRPVLIGIAGDSGAGKSSLVAQLAKLLGSDRVSVIELDGYHSLNRPERKAVNITALHPRANNLGLFIDHLYRLRKGEKVLRPVYNHDTGDFDDPVWVEPRPYVIVEGLHPFLFQVAADMYDLKIYYDTHEELKVRWKILRDATARGYTVEEVLAEIRKRQWDIRNFVEPQLAMADTVVKLFPLEDERPDAVGVEFKESTDNPWLKEKLEQISEISVQPMRDWIGGREFLSLSFSQAIPVSTAHVLLEHMGPRGGAILRKITHAPFVMPYQLALAILASWLEAIRQELDATFEGRGRSVVG